MNPEIDITHFRRGAQGSDATSAHNLVAPPRRIFTRYVIPSLLITAFAAISAYAFRESLTPATSVKIVLPVLVPAIAAMDTQDQADASGANPTLFQAPGWIEPDPFPITISALIPGTLLKVNAREGDQVASGTVVAELDAGTARLTQKLAEAALGVRQAELDAAQGNWDHPIALQEEVRIAESEKAKLDAEKLKAEQQLLIAQKEATIAQMLTNRGASGELSAQKAALEAQFAQTAIKAVEIQLRSAEAAVTAANTRLALRLDDKQKLAMAKAQLEEAKIAVEEARLRVERCSITAPTSGTVMRLYSAPGSMLSETVEHGTRILSMYDPDSLQVRAEVPLAEAAKIRQGLHASIIVDALPDKKFRGEISRIVHEADVQRNTLPIKVRILDPEPTLKPEMIARLEFSAPHLPRSSDSKPATKTVAAEGGISNVSIPASLIPAGAKEAKLWFVGADQRAHLRTVTLGAKQGELRHVVSGVQPPDKIIASNTEKLTEGSRVRIEGTE